jgi:hypothetical protein
MRNFCISGLGRARHKLRFPACPLFFRQPFAKQEAVVKAVAIHAGVFAYQDQPDDNAFNLAATPVTMNIKTATAGALSDGDKTF